MNNRMYIPVNKARMLLVNYGKNQDLPRIWQKIMFMKIYPHECFVGKDHKGYYFTYQLPKRIFCINS